MGLKDLLTKQYSKEMTYDKLIDNYYINTKINEFNNKINKRLSWIAGVTYGAWDLIKAYKDQSIKIIEDIYPRTGINHRTDAIYNERPVFTVLPKWVNPIIEGSSLALTAYNVLKTLNEARIIKEYYKAKRKNLSADLKKENKSWKKGIFWQKIGAGLLYGGTEALFKSLAQEHSNDLRTIYVTDTKDEAINVNDGSITGPDRTNELSYNTIGLGLQAGYALYENYLFNPTSRAEKALNALGEKLCDDYIDLNKPDATAVNNLLNNNDLTIYNNYFSFLQKLPSIINNNLKTDLENNIFNKELELPEYQLIFKAIKKYRGL